MLIDLDYITILPNELLRKGFSLREDIGVYEIAWRYSDIMEVLNIVKDKKMVILGGDVYELDNKIPFPTYDSWSFSEKNYKKSFDKAVEYISNYHSANGDNFIYTIVVSKEANE